jgi:hypothetical protein
LTAIGIVNSNWPYLALQYQKVSDDDGNGAIEFFVVNEGSGPALVKSITLTYGGRTYSNFHDALSKDALTTISASDVTFTRPNAISGAVVPPYKSLTFVHLAGTDHQKVWNAWKDPRASTFDICYCSSASVSWFGQAALWVTGTPVCWIANREHKPIPAPNRTCPENEFED